MSPLIVDGPTVDREELTELSREALLKILKKKYPFNHYDRKAGAFKIEYWETNKIRILLARFRNTGGYPVRFDHHVDYFSGLAQWIKDQWVIEPKTTRKGWREKEYLQWRQVCIMKIDQYTTLEDAYISNSPSQIPFIGGAIMGAVDQVELALAMSSRKWVDIYPNLLFYNTINDMVIWANWDLVLDDLVKIQSLKYLPPKEEVIPPGIGGYI